MCAILPLKEQWRSEREKLLVLKGKVSKVGATNISCNILFDIGCEEVVISKHFADCLELQRQIIDLMAELWNRTLVPMEHCTQNLVTQTGCAAIAVWPYVGDWIAYDIILGKSWLSDADPIINWKSNRMLLQQENSFLTLDTNSDKHRTSLPFYFHTGEQFARVACRKRCALYHIMLRPKQDEEGQDESNPREVQNL